MTLISRRLAVLLMFCGLATVAIAGQASYSQRQLAECLAHYSAATADANRARWLAYDEYVESTDSVWSAVLGAPSRERARRTFAEYIAARERTRMAQEAHPLPDPPTIEQCKERK